MVDSAECFRVPVDKERFGLRGRLDPSTPRAGVLEVRLLPETVKFLGDPALQDVLVILEGLVATDEYELLRGVLLRRHMNLNVLIGATGINVRGLEASEGLSCLARHG